MHEEYANIALHLNWNVGILEQWLNGYGPSACSTCGSEGILG